MASANNQFKSHDDARRARELEEARKAGLAPAAVDEHGRAINPHIPAYMANAPWYLGSTAPTLRHQKDWRKGDVGSSSSSASASAAAAASSRAKAAVSAPPPPPPSRRGEKIYQASTFRKGACENCGSMSHKARDCLERPRARGAKLTGKHIAPDEAVLLAAPDASRSSASKSSASAAGSGPSSASAHLVRGGVGVGVDASAPRSSYDGKHDRWEGYDPRDHDRVVDLFEKVEKAKAEAKRVAELEKRFRKKKKKEKKKKGDGGGGGGDDDDDDDDSSSSSSSSSSDDDDDEEQGTASNAAAANEDDDDPEGKEKLADDADAAFTKLEKRVRSAGGGASGSVRNLRIREDTAKYLLNLDPDSAYFDPKSRSMRGDPTPHIPREKKAFAGDGAFVRPAGTIGGGGIAAATPSDYQAWASLQRHAEAAAAAGADVHVAAAPSAAEALAREHARRRAALDAATRAKVLDRYGDGGASVVRLGGGSSSSNNDASASRDEVEEEARRLLYGASERYVEYSKKTGKPILPGGGGGLAVGKALAASMPRSTLYEEDVFPGNHSSVWGSWWHSGTRSWGFACCHSTTKNSYCLGEAGKKAAAAAAEQLEANLRSMEERKKKEEEEGEKKTTAASTTSLLAKHQQQQQHQKQSLGASIGAGLFSEDTGASALDVGELDPKKLAAALAAEDERKKRKAKEEEEEEEEEERRRRKKDNKKKKNKKDKEKKRSSDSDSSGSSSSEEESDDDDDGGGRRRRKRRKEEEPSSSFGGAAGSGVPLSAEELEAYRLRRERADDPMLRLQQPKKKKEQEEEDNDGGGSGKGGYDFV